jgi:mannitol/fructose-specific phosphotransferase system IIA component (Ntr-type)
MDPIRESIEKGAFLLDLRAGNIEEVCDEALDHCAHHNLLPEALLPKIKQAVLQREKLESTAIGNAVSVPHGYLEGIVEPLTVVIRLRQPVNLDAPDDLPVRFVFLLLGPPDAPVSHLEALAHIARLMSDDDFRYDFDNAASRARLLAAIDAHETKLHPQPTPKLSEVPDAALRPLKVPASGLLRDMRRRYPFYLSDLKDGFSRKSLSAILFLFFACLAPSVTFGGVMAEQTAGAIGVSEMLLATAACGCVFALLSGQPLLLLGGTGPMLAITGILFGLSKQLSLPFLPFYGWVGMWAAGFVVILALLNASSWMRFFTRFTEEVFIALISFIFVIEAMRAIGSLFTGQDVAHDTALLSLVLAWGTFYLAANLFHFRRSRYLGPKARNFFADFGPTIALVVMSLIAWRLNEVHLHPLEVPDSFSTTSGRSWLVDFAALPNWARWGAAVPAAFVAILIYLDQNITSHIINNRRHKLKKPGGYHLDLMLVGLMVAACSTLGLPWLVAATVRSLNHVRSLATTEQAQSIYADEAGERIVHTDETRVSGLVVHLAIGASLLLLSYLKLIPMAVLYGLFLYMGVMSMRGNEFFARVLLLATESSLYPSSHYVRKVPRMVIHKFTAIQAACLAILWLVKASTIAILFPVCIALMVPLRRFSRRLFDEEHLAALDRD